MVSVPPYCGTTELVVDVGVVVGLVVTIDVGVVVVVVAAVVVGVVFVPQEINTRVSTSKQDKIRHRVLVFTCHYPLYPIII